MKVLHIEEEESEEEEEVATRHRTHNDEETNFASRERQMLDALDCEPRF